MFIWLIIPLKQAFKIYVPLEFELCNTCNYSIVFKIILTRCASKWLDSSGSHSGAHHKTRCALTHLLKVSYSCVIIQSIAHNSMHTKSQYTCILQFNTYSIYHIHSISTTMLYSQCNMLSHLMNHINIT